MCSTPELRSHREGTYERRSHFFEPEERGVYVVE